MEEGDEEAKKAESSVKVLPTESFLTLLKKSSGKKGDAGEEAETHTPAGAASGKGDGKRKWAVLDDDFGMNPTAKDFGEGSEDDASVGEVGDSDEEEDD